MTRLLCLLGFHDWHWVTAQDRAPFGFVCPRCGKVRWIKGGKA